MRASSKALQISQTFRSRGLIPKGAIPRKALSLMESLIEEALNEAESDGMNNVLSFFEGERTPIPADRWDYLRRKVKDAGRRVRSGDADGD